MADRSLPTYGPDDRNWWLVGNAHGGLSAAYGTTAAEARAEARASIAEAFLTEGLSASAARRGAQSYRVAVHAGGLTYDEARAARDEWNTFGLDHDSPRRRLATTLAATLRNRWLAQTGQRPDRHQREDAR